MLVASYTPGVYPSWAAIHSWLFSVLPCVWGRKGLFSRLCKMLC